MLTCTGFHTNHVKLAAAPANITAGRFGLNNFEAYRKILRESCKTRDCEINADSNLVVTARSPVILAVNRDLRLGKGIQAEYKKK